MSALPAIAALCVGTAVLSHAALAEEKEAPVIEDGKSVSIEYTLKTDDGTVADTNVGGEPLVYEQGKSQILPALENALEGLTVGDTKEVTLSAEQGYGPTNPELVQTVPTDQIPEEGRQVGATLIAQSPDGQQRPIRVTEVHDDEVVVDLNHPLAGEALHFDVKVLSID